MFHSRRKMSASFVLIVILVMNFVFVDAKRPFSSGKSKPTGGWSAKPRPKPPHTPITPRTPHNSGTIRKKDSSDIFIRTEGGGKTQPGGKMNDPRQQSLPHQPSAPNEPISKKSQDHVLTQGPSPGLSNPSGVYPAWANPSTNHNSGSNPHAPFPGVTHTLQPHGVPSFPNNPSQPNQNKPLTSAPYPPTHPSGPLSYQPINPNNGAPRGIPSQPPNFYPYPNPPYGMPHLQTPAPYPPAHHQGMPYPPHAGFGNGAHGGVYQPIGATQNYQPVGSSPSHGGFGPTTVVHNHYNAPPLGSPQNPAGHPPIYGQQPSAYGGAPMGQPFVPGQTVVVLPNQQSHDSGRGLGQIFKEALVFSTVNAGVNRIINGPSHQHHHHQDAYPSMQPAAPGATATTSTVTNTVIYNNQYGNPVPVASGTPLQGQTGQSATIAGNTTGTSNLPTGTAPSLYPNIGSGTFSTSGGQYAGPTGATVGGQSTNGPDANYNRTELFSTTSGPTNNSTDNQAGQPVQEFQYFIGNEELWNITEKLFAKDEINASRYITLNLQSRSVKENATDEAPRPLLYVHTEAYALPTVQAIRDVYDNYEYDSEKKEIMDSYKHRQENALLDVFFNTDIMTIALNWLSAKGYIESDDFEWKDTIRHIWMSRVNGATSGFERIFMAERYPGASIIGGQNWMYFEYLETLGRINYMSYVEKINLGNKATLVKINYKIDEIVKSNTTMLIGTPPELEMALYTICYYVRPNDLCTVSLGGTKLNIYTHAFRYFGKDVMDLGLMFY